MPNTLRQIIGAVGAAENLQEALLTIVARVKAHLAADVCAIYLKDEQQGGYVLMATEGTDSSVFRRVHPGDDDSLVRLVAERQEPVKLDDARTHPCNTTTQYRAFLGVPIIHFRQVIGVLVVQHWRERCFQGQEVDFMSTIAAQLAGVISHAKVTGEVARLLQGQAQTHGLFQGVPGASGVAIGTVAVPRSFTRLRSVPERKSKNIDADIKVFKTALAQCQQELRSSNSELEAALPGEERALLDVYALLLDSESLLSETLERIRRGSWAPAAWRDTIVEHARRFEHMDDDYLRARAEDIREIGRSVLRHLLPAEGMQEYPERCVLVSDEVGIAQIAEVPLTKLVGIVSCSGSSLSHTAVLARALGVPAVMGLVDLPIKQLDGCQVIIDGYQGCIHIQPSAALLDEYHAIIQEEAQLAAGLETLRTLPAETLDGSRVALYVKVGLPAEISQLRGSHIEGIGLYRTEFTFMTRDTFPSEEAQHDVYRQVLSSVAPRPVIMRTLDAGGDKMLPYFPIEEANPFLGWRGIRLSLDHPDIFLTQLRAMLRANVGLNNLHIMFPMIASVDELDETIVLLRKAEQELRDEGETLVECPLGIMVEVPAAVYQAEVLAKRVDFLSIGTNDLAQYILAVDRDNARVANHYDTLHPAVISAIHQVVQSVRRQGKQVGVCGEMASDPAAVLLLLAMGIDHMSTSFSRLLAIKRVIRSFTSAAGRSVA